MSSTTLRDLNGLESTPASLDDATLVLIDYQNTYTTGVMELDGWKEALERASACLQQARHKQTPVIHVRHDGGAGSPYDLSTHLGAIHDDVAPRDGEPVVTKQAPDAFVGTDLAEHIAETGRDKLIVIGFMTHMCVTFTSQGAFLRQLAPTVVADACATRPLETDVAPVDSAQMHAGALATIGDLYGVVVPRVADLA
ncbi:cysteine hydrolase family protein [Haloglycomyces albus]|uniref:cysteine hydrolase family protein n=1 Tax=Haloglycomyces albus TaxID=526067 RepID=UPI00046CC6F3|nr:cysteine hydrolase family protein [Haloglycomyces albus]